MHRVQNKMVRVFCDKCGVQDMLWDLHTLGGLHCWVTPPLQLLLLLLLGLGASHLPSPVRMQAIAMADRQCERALQVLQVGCGGAGGGYLGQKGRGEVQHTQHELDNVILWVFIHI